ncbi:hypothetical protein [Mesorhizobium sp.]|nr:hypothetical protein [Mesorhizobium sp.]
MNLRFIKPMSPTLVEVPGRVKTLKREDKLRHATLRAIREAD